MALDGVRSVNYVVLTQDKDWVGDPMGENKFGQSLIGTYMTDGIADGSNGREGYGYAYDFSRFYKWTDSNENVNHPVAGNGVILPSVSPSVFELKYPNENVKGVVH